MQQHKYLPVAPLKGQIKGKKSQIKAHNLSQKFLMIMKYTIRILTKLYNVMEMRHLIDCKQYNQGKAWKKLGDPVRKSVYQLHVECNLVI